MDLRAARQATVDNLDSLKLFVSGDNEQKLNSWTIYEFFAAWDRLKKKIDAAKQNSPDIENTEDGN